MPRLLTRRVLTGGVLVATAMPAALFPAQARATLKTFKNPGCACCDGWARHVRSAGFTVTLTETPDLDRIRAEAGVPEDLAGCHTSFFGPFVAEGHVPAAAITRLLADGAGWRGIAVADMPIGSPGMEVARMEAELYEIWAFSAKGERKLFARARGSQLLDS